MIETTSETPFLSAQELAARYAVPDYENNLVVWWRVLKGWRDRRLLRFGRDYRFRKCEGCIRREYVYNPERVLALVRASDSPFCVTIQSMISNRTNRSNE
jgi:hypothetical protein